VTFKPLALLFFTLQLCSIPAFAARDNFGLGTGRDGPLTVTTTGRVINSYAQVSLPIATGDTAIDVSNAAGFAGGDLILILQTTGIIPEPSSGGASPIDLSADRVGSFEFARLSGVGGSTLSMTHPVLNTYASIVTQVIRVPEYTTVTIDAGRSITASPWNGTTGGIVAFLATETVTNNGQITVTGRGFRGAASANDPSGNTGCTSLDEPAPQGGQRGEDIAYTAYGPSQTGRGRRGSGAAGGVCLHSGGGGGGHGGEGGQGGNTANADGNRPFGGQGGTALTYSLLDHMTFGGGGGAGHSNSASGAAGGGIIFLRAAQLAGAGTILANGSGVSDSPSGGSGGGLAA
jgi:hypothetical protein